MADDDVVAPLFTPEQEAWLETFIRRTSSTSSASGSSSGAGGSSSDSSASSGVSTGGIGELFSLIFLSLH